MKSQLSEQPSEEKTHLKRKRENEGGRKETASYIKRKI